VSAYFDVQAVLYMGKGPRFTWTDKVSLILLLVAHLVWSYFWLSWQNRFKVEKYNLLYIYIPLCQLRNLSSKKIEIYVRQKIVGFLFKYQRRSNTCTL